MLILSPHICQYITMLQEVLGFGNGAVEVCVLLVCGTTSLDGLCQTFRDSLVVSFSRVEMCNEKMKYEVLDFHPLKKWLLRSLETSTTNRPVTLISFSLSFMFSNQNVIRFYQIFQSCYMSKMSHPCRFEDKW